MLYISEIGGHNDLGYISSYYEPLTTFWKEVYDIDI